MKTPNRKEPATAGFGRPASAGCALPSLLSRWTCGGRLFRVVRIVHDLGVDRRTEIALQRADRNVDDGNVPLWYPPNYFRRHFQRGWHNTKDQATDGARDENQHSKSK